MYNTALDNVTRIQQSETRELSLTFKEDKIPITVFINCINARRQAPPEVSNLHGVSIHHPVVSDSPKPLVLQSKQKQLSTGARPPGISLSCGLLLLQVSSAVITVLYQNSQMNSLTTCPLGSQRFL